MMNLEDKYYPLMELGNEQVYFNPARFEAAIEKEHQYLVEPTLEEFLGLIDNDIAGVVYSFYETRRVE
jgi:hypothetical protein